MGFSDWFGTKEGGIPAGSPDPSKPHQLALYKFNSCPYCRRVMKGIESFSLDVEMRDIQQTSQHRKALKTKTGRTTVPCLFIDGEPMFESMDILAWLKAHDAAMNA